MLKRKILQRESGIITYGITPPKKSNSHEKIVEIAEKQIERLNGLNIDGLVIYDIQDESERTSENRPFPFLPTIDSSVYGMNYLKDLDVPKIIYKSVGKYNESELFKFIDADSHDDKFSVFVGASSSNQVNSMRLDDAYSLCKRYGSKIILGGVTIPERHITKYNEHLRVIKKIENGCKYFISQAVYNVEASKNFLSDYYYYCQNNSREMVPILFTLTPCGSLKTLEFMKWLGINIPRWIENDLQNSEDILNKSVEVLKKQFIELLDFSKDKKIPIGCNVESVSVRKVEIEASIQLIKDVMKILETGV